MKWTHCLLIALVALLTAMALHCSAKEPAAVEGVDDPLFDFPKPKSIVTVPEKENGGWWGICVEWLTVLDWMISGVFQTRRSSRGRI